MKIIINRMQARFSQTQAGSVHN